MVAGTISLNIRQLKSEAVSPTVDDVRVWVPTRRLGHMKGVNTCTSLSRLYLTSVSGNQRVVGSIEIHSQAMSNMFRVLPILFCNSVTYTPVLYYRRPIPARSW